jgi:hypothetical protein
MTSTFLSMAVALAIGSSGWPGAGPATSHTHTHPLLRPGGRILPDGPGNGWGFPNGNPDGYGWFDHGTALPLGANRTAEYYFPRYFAVPANQMFLPAYYNPYITRGQRYIPYAGCGGGHPMGGPPMASAATPVHPYQESIGRGPRIPVPPFTGRVEAPPTNTTGSTGLTP